MDANASKKTPWHLWVVGGLGLLWNAGGAFDFFMMQTKNPDYLAQITPEMLSYYDNFPIWMVGAWAVAVLGAVLGSVLLLLRSRFAEPVFYMALAGLIVSLFHNYGLNFSQTTAMMSLTSLIFSGAIVVGAVFFALYSRRMAQRDILR